jgi:hypothetical protein
VDVHLHGTAPKDCLHGGHRLHTIGNINKETKDIFNLLYIYSNCL